jgi:hypothetical protein
MAREVTDLRSRLEASIERIPEAGCWIWLGMLNEKGYGRVRTAGKHGPKTGAHRVVWEAYRGSIPHGLLVLHHCDVPCCVNPGHLFLGTQKDNMQDAARKGRCYRQERVYG